MIEHIEFEAWILERATYWHKSGKTSAKSYKQCMKNARTK